MKKSHLSTRVDKIVILNLFGLNNRQPSSSLSGARSDPGGFIVTFFLFSPLKILIISSVKFLDSSCVLFQFLFFLSCGFSDESAALVVNMKQRRLKSLLSHLFWFLKRKHALYLDTRIITFFPTFVCRQKRFPLHLFHLSIRTTRLPLIQTTTGSLLKKD